MKKKAIIIVLFTLLLTLAGGLYYFNRFILPSIVREKAISSLSELTGGKVVMGDISFSLFRGIVVSDLILFDKDDAEKQLCRVKEAQATFLIPPLFKNRSLIIPSLKLKAVDLNIIRQKDNSFNISYIIDKFKQANGRKNKQLTLLVRSMKITDSVLSFTDDSFDTPVSFKLDIIESSARINWNKLNCELIAGLSRPEKGEKTDLRLKGSYAFSNRNVKGNLLINNADLKTYIEYLKDVPLTLIDAAVPELKADFLLDDNYAKASVELRFSPLSFAYKEFNLKDAGLQANLQIHAPRQDLENTSYQGKLMFEGGLFSIQRELNASGKIEESLCDFLIEKDTASINSNISISGLTAEKDTIKVSGIDAEANVKAHLPFKITDDLTASYEGTVSVKGGSAYGIKTIDIITDIASNFKFKNKGQSLKNAEVSIEEASAKILDTPVAISGGIKDNLLNMKISGNFDINKIKNLVPSTITLPPYEISGTTNINLHLSSDLSVTEVPLFYVEAGFKEITLNLPENNLEFFINKGALEFNPRSENLHWLLEEVEYLDNTYRIEGEMNGFITSSISADISGKDVRIQADIVKQKELLNITSLRGKIKNSELNVGGELNLEKDLNLKASASLDLGDLKELLPETKQIFEKTGLEGRISADAQIWGPTKDYRLWNVRTKALSELIKCYGLKFQYVKLDYELINKKGFLNKLSFDAYQGRGSVNGRLNFSEEFSYNLQASCQDINLHLVKLDTPWKDKTFFGTLSTNLLISGVGRDLKGLAGEGTLNIKNGNVWEFNPLKGLGNFLFIPRFTNITFSHAQGDFFIKDGYISTDNLELLGPELGLIIEGNVSFEGKLNLLVNTQVLKPGLTEAQKDKGAAGKVTEAISQVGSLSAIKITGTTKEPKYKLQPIAENIIKKVGDFVSDIFQ